MLEKKLLIVEDDPIELETWKKQIKRNNIRKDLSDSVDFAVSYSEAEDLLKGKKYDAAIVDIRLTDASGAQDANDDGNAVRDLILSSEILLIAHLTGEPDAVSQTDQNYVDLVRVFPKGSGDEGDIPIHEEILDWLEAKKSIISAMRAVKSNITSKMAELFYLSIWPRWDNWHAAMGEGEDFISSSITRHITSHLYSSFLEDGGGKVHPEEWYFLPPSSERFHTGDLMKVDDAYYVLVTPRCDLERLADQDTLLVAKLEVAENWLTDKSDTDEKIANIKEQISNSDADEAKITSLQKKINSTYSDFRQKYYGHKKGKFNYHFLPEVNLAPGKTHGPFFVNFSDIRPVIVSSEEAKRLKESKIAALSPEFVPSLVQRLGAFISRIGSPDYSHFP